MVVDVALASPHAPEVEPQRPEPGAGRALGHGDHDGVVHVAAVARMGVGHDDRAPRRPVRLVDERVEP